MRTPSVSASYFPLPSISSAMDIVLGANVADTLVVPAMVTVQTPFPPQAPSHPRNTEPGDGVAVSVTVVSAPNGCEHVAPQSMPDGVLVTRPEPVPSFVTVSTRPFGSCTVCCNAGDVAGAKLLSPEYRAVI